MLHAHESPYDYLLIELAKKNMGFRLNLREIGNNRNFNAKKKVQIQNNVLKYYTL